MVAQLPYTRTIWYHTPTSRYPLERGGTKKKKIDGHEFTHLRETDDSVYVVPTVNNMHVRFAIHEFISGAMHRNEWQGKI
jgi:hypothetical protein